MTREFRVLYDSSHWVAVACDQTEVVLADSLGKPVSSLVSKQLKQLYRHRVDDNGELNVSVVRCVQQPNGSDCGVFAAAFVFEWATTSVAANLDVAFDVPKMRKYLMQCLERQEV